MLPRYYANILQLLLLHMGNRIKLFWHAQIVERGERGGGGYKFGRAETYACSKPAKERKIKDKRGKAKTTLDKMADPDIVFESLELISY